jgi:hypothetical protein
MNSGLGRVLDNPDLNDPQENHARLRLLYLIKRQLIGEVPPDTQWYLVQNLKDNELSELHILGRCGLTDDSNRNNLLKVAPRFADGLRAPPPSWDAIIHFGHDKTGPFTIIEGNHRLMAYATSPRAGLNIPVYVGLSPTPFFFNLFDPPEMIANDLWK